MSLKHFRLLIIGCSLITSNLLASWTKLGNSYAALSQDNSPARVAQNDDLKDIVALYQRGYDLSEQDESHARQMLNHAAQRLKVWISRYEKDSGKLSFLQARTRLGLYFEAAGKKKEAIEVYRSCSRHPLLNSANATLTFCDKGEKIGQCSIKKPLAKVLTQRLNVLTGRVESKDETQGSRKKTIIRGRSKGNIILPPRLGDIDFTGSLL